jgi:hypothetical protein
MFSSVGKYLQESSTVASALNAAAQAASQTTLAVSQATATVTPAEVYCTNANANATDDLQNCKKNISLATFYGNKTSSNKCKKCCKLFCSVCITKSSFKVPGFLLDVEFHPPMGKKYDDTYQLLCAPCMERAQLEAIEIFLKEMNETYGPNLEKYVSATANASTTEVPQYFFPMPSDESDSRTRQAMRFAHMADVVKDVVGIKLVVNVAKFGYAGKQLMDLVIGADAKALLTPLMDALALYGITGPTALARCYYLSCKHNLDTKLLSAHAIESTIRGTFAESAERTGAASSSTIPDLVAGLGFAAAAAACRNEYLGPCPLSLIQYLSDYASIAQWLYLSEVPNPRSGNDWSSWYLSQLIRQRGWTLLMCINETTKLPSGAKVPAFCVVARTSPSNVTNPNNPSGLHREAMLVVRGSKSSMDWAINMEESTVPLQYHCGSPAGSVVTGQAHKGIYRGAMGILDGYGVRAHLQILLIKGYTVKVVGHSLGAGTAALIAADMRSIINKEGSQGDVSAVVFASPAVVTEDLADAFVRDGLLINSVSGDDIVPRISRRTIAGLARQLTDESFGKRSDVWYAKDKADLTHYVYSMGKASKLEASRGGQEEEIVTPPLEIGASMADFSAHSPISSGAQGVVVGGGATLNASSPSASPGGAMTQDPTSFAVLVSPGPIVHFYSNSENVYSAAVITHRHPVLHEVRLLLAKANEVHSMKMVVQAIFSIRQQLQHGATQAVEPGSEEELCAKGSELLRLSLSPTLRKAILAASESWDVRSSTRASYSRQCILRETPPISAGTNGAPTEPVKPAKPDPAGAGSDTGTNPNPNPNPTVTLP